MGMTGHLLFHARGMPRLSKPTEPHRPPRSSDAPNAEKGFPSVPCIGILAVASRGAPFSVAASPSRR